MQFDNEENSQVLALDKNTGNEIWRTMRDEISTWSTPYIWKSKERTELVTGGKKTRSYNPDNGDLLWELDMRGGRDITSPVGSEEMIYLVNEERRDGGGTLFAVKAGASGDITPKEGESTSDGVVWSMPDAGISMPSPVLYNGYIYLANRRNGFMARYDAATGTPSYQQVRTPGATAFWSTPWVYDDKLFCVDESGTTYVLGTGDEFEVLYQNPIADKIWTSAAFSEGTIVLRGVKNVYCIRKRK